MADFIGLKLGNYRIVRLIGRGGFANVYLGEHIYLKIPAAIKVLNIQLVNDALESFLNEARIIALLEHSHIIRVLEFGVEGGITPFLVMNYAENGTLRQRYPRKSTLPWPEILSSTKQVAEALQYAHDHGVIYRDVKPENMLLGKNQRILLSDFGLALLPQSQLHLSGSAGTTAYMAPEQLQGNPCPASDQYALGIVVYEWLCGSLPFTGAEREMTIQQLYATPPTIRTKVPDISPAIEQTIMKALAKDPQARFATVQEFAQALEQANPAGTSLTTTEKGRATSPVIPPERVYEQADAVSSEGLRSDPAPQQEPMGMPSASNFFPQLPLLVYESPLTNSGRLLQPSLGPSISSPDKPWLSTAFSLEDDSAPSSHMPLPLSTPTTQLFPDLSTPAFLPVTQIATERQCPSFPQIQQAGTRIAPLSRRTAFIAALIGLVLLGFMLVAGRGIWLQNVHTPQKASFNQYTPSSLIHHTTATTHPTPVHGAGSPSDTHPSVTNAPVVATHSGSTPVPAMASTPGPQPTPAMPPTPLPSPGVTPTPVVPLTVVIVSAPDSAVAGTTITVVTQASEGGVTISLDGIVRHFGQQIADRQGNATFQFTAPKGNRIALTATATDANGDQVHSARQYVIITKSS